VLCKAIAWLTCLTSTMAMAQVPQERKKRFEKWERAERNEKVERTEKLDRTEKKQLPERNNFYKPEKLGNPEPKIISEKKESFGYFGGVGTGFSYFKETTPKPDSGNPDQAVCNLPTFESPFSQVKGCVQQERNTLLFDAMAGARTRNSDEIFFMAYYKYSLFWDVDSKRAGNFGNWFQSPSSTTSPLPTRGLFRIHEGFADVRYLWDPVRFGMQAQLALGRINSALFSQKGENAESTYSSEAFIPYALYTLNRYYRARFYLPIYTVVNKENKDLTYTTFSLNDKGRGAVGSAGLTQSFFWPQASMVFAWDLSYMDYKFRAVTNDRTRISTQLESTWTSERYSFFSLFPSQYSLSGTLGYLSEQYYVPTVVIPSFRTDPETTEPAAQLKRVDSRLKYGLEASADLNLSHRVSYELTFESSNSNVREWSSRNFLMLVRYRWMLPSLAEVGRYLRNTDRNPINGTFEGDGGL
jgi:hypothetical protein